MNNELITINEFYLFTFVSTSHALKAEKVLKNAGGEFIMIPTLREISSSCGLSIKIAPPFLKEYQELFKENKVALAGTYYVTKEQGKNLVRKLDA
ncbi:Protein of unknown function DUF3343 [Syntrophomonas zehnderi OL-4]|uniref:Putative Se/S carrier protein-like domain-containing protein n=1 Tax=Syntrophomonas zehnderi OL-4 TaxID=690567 RepID=A0A0E4C7G3_9FIRM|nr:DUF3343 domain-containing protein [Syntrophomonas zehnderi]CFW97553.1 Protein of unknown function DUF3343 [Syntrophomonas zehnderi OL-4]